MRTIGVAEFTAGPLPSPAILKRYDEVVPGSAERILQMAEAQSRHRRQLEHQVIFSRIRNSRLGLVFGLLIGIVSLTAATIAAVNGGTVVGSVIGVSGLASLVGVFVYGSQQQREERKERRQETGYRQ